MASLNVVLPGRCSRVTPETVHAVFGERAMKVLLLLNRARVGIVGAGTGTLDALIAQSLFRVRSLINEPAFIHEGPSRRL